MLKITATGNLTSNITLKTDTVTGIPSAILRIASDRKYRDKNGNKLTDFISIKVRGPLAERCAEHLEKGAKIAASGDFETVVVAQEDGSVQTGFLIKATEVEFLSSRRMQPDTDHEELAFPDLPELPELANL